MHTELMLSTISGVCESC